MTFRTYLPFVVAMALVVVASNILVQFPVQGSLGSLSLADILTWGAFTYPVAFLVTDLANRRHGPSFARRVVFVGFVAAVTCSILVPPLLYRLGLIEFDTAAGRLVRIAIASGTAFLTAQLLDVTVFNWLRRQSWWRAPIFGTLAGSVVDTMVFFSIAFAAAFAFVGPSDAFALETAPLLGVLPAEAARWISWALGDLTVKLIIAVFALIPYRLIAARWSQPAVLA
ncbi:queuosine precursor transporter [Mesorhizobium sp. LHD-90]|uniref:queuosine precursor transporter n=1 Tax=Mesorhizobium sp. LHD-90 TaxID=3071414 RepID=UPI0027E115E2|nr:queuosine precursor transporter [Mesorhizobium sp. LHD-90]MDQ6432633.1 queuosine precursor transporter [Mesorhizobium sp. LHD-90]